MLAVWSFSSECRDMRDPECQSSLRGARTYGVMRTAVIDEMREVWSRE